MLLLKEKKEIFLSEKTNFCKKLKNFFKNFCFSIFKNTKRNLYLNTVFDNAIMMPFYATIKNKTQKHTICTDALLEALPYMAVSNEKRKN